MVQSITRLSGNRQLARPPGLHIQRLDPQPHLWMDLRNTRPNHLSLPICQYRSRIPYPVSRIPYRGSHIPFRCFFLLRPQTILPDHHPLPSIPWSLETQTLVHPGLYSNHAWGQHPAHRHPLFCTCISPQLLGLHPRLDPPPLLLRHHLPRMAHLAPLFPKT